MKEISHKELVAKGAKWLNKTASNILYRSQFVLAEFKCQGINEIPDIFGLRPYGSVLIEVKTSRADFKADAKKRGRDISKKQIGSNRFYLAPKGLIKVWELPKLWGLLEWNGKGIEMIVASGNFNTDYKATVFIYHSILRRLHKPQVFNFNLT